MKTNAGRMVLALLSAVVLYGGSGCAVVTGAMPSTGAVTGEAWYTEGKGFMGFALSSRVFYCPAVTAAGPATCKQAKMVSLTKEEMEQEKTADKANDEASK